MVNSGTLRFELVIPAYNESKNLPILLDRVVKSALAAGYDVHEFKLVVVNNGSTDDSCAVLESLSKTALGTWFRVVEVTANQGYGHGLWCGLNSTKAPVVGWTHADMQTDPVDAFKACQMVSESRASKVLVKGKRHGRNWKDSFVSHVFEGFTRLMLGLKTREINAQPKVFNRELLALLTAPPKSFAFDLYALYHAERAGFTVQAIPVLFPPRIHGVSNWAATFFGRYKTILGMISYIQSLCRSEGRL